MSSLFVISVPWSIPRPTRCPIVRPPCPTQCVLRSVLLSPCVLPSQPTQCPWPIVCGADCVVGSPIRHQSRLWLLFLPYGVTGKESTSAAGSTGRNPHGLQRSKRTILLRCGSFTPSHRLDSLADTRSSPVRVLERGTPAGSLALPLPAWPLGEFLSSLILPLSLGSGAKGKLIAASSEGCWSKE